MPMSAFMRPFIIPVFLPQVGCPHQCAFCNQRLITGVQHSFLSPDQLRSLIDRFLQYKGTRRGVTQISFYGGNFLGLEKGYMIDLLQTASSYVLQGKVDSLRFSTRPDTVDDVRLDIIGKFPVKTVELGVQSMDDSVLMLSKRGHTARDTELAVERLKRKHYEIGLQMMVGLPGDDEKTSMETARRIASLFPDFVRIYPTLVIENSLLAMWYRQGRYSPLSLEQGISRVKHLYLLFSKHNIKVIRMGLQPTDDLSEKTAVLAGPYHPSFGHLVYSDIFLDMAISRLDSKPVSAESVTVRVHPRSISRFRGHKNRNIQILQARFHITALHIVADFSMSENALRIEISG